MEECVTRLNCTLNINFPLQNKESQKGRAVSISKEQCIRYLTIVLCGHLDDEEATRLDLVVQLCNYTEILLFDDLCSTFIIICTQLTSCNTPPESIHYFCPSWINI